MKKRFIILKENHLFCYDNHKKTRITELHNLSSFLKARSSQKEVSQFEIMPENKKDTVIVFQAESIDDAEEWVSVINQSINPSAVALEDNAPIQKQKAIKQGTSLPSLLCSLLYT